MKLEEWKNAYPTAEEYYDAFHGSQEGDKIWDVAHEASQEDWDEEGDDEEPLIVAHDIVIAGMESWLLDDMSDDEYDKASQWFETMRDNLSESIFGGLT